jgi:hypothetical protein
LGVKINFHKSEIYYFGKAKEDEHLYREIFGCESGVFPDKSILHHYFIS